MHISDLDTPALLLDLDIMERNLRRVADYAATHGLRLRPHTKTHKVPAIGKLQLAAGAAGLTVAKVGEAEVMLATDPPDMLVAYPVIGQIKLARLMQVAQRTQITVALDSLSAACQLADAAQHAGVTIGVLVEVDMGLGRVGVSTSTELLALALEIKRLPYLTFAGIAFFPGHITVWDDTGKEAWRCVGQKLELIMADFRRAGVPVRIVSGGSTPTLFHSHEVPGLNEIRPGTYIYNDMNTVRSGACSINDCAASILVTVISTAVPGRVIVDGGSKTFSSDRPVGTNTITFGHTLETPDSLFSQMNEEHGFIDIRDTSSKFAIGDRVRIIPNHICPAVNLHEQIYGIRNGKVEQVWQVEGRGKLQ